MENKARLEEIRDLVEELEDSEAYAEDQIEALKTEIKEINDQLADLAEEYRSLSGTNCDCEFLGIHGCSHKF